MKLTVCDACRRHVRVEELACPFCGAHVARASDARAGGAPRDRFTLLFGAAVAGALSVTSCNQDRADDRHSVVAPYGVPIPVDAGSETTPAAPDAAAKIAAPSDASTASVDVGAARDAGASTKKADPQVNPRDRVAPVPPYGVPAPPPDPRDPYGGRR